MPVLIGEDSVNDSLVGGVDNDTLVGLGGSDILKGNPGADYIDGGQGNDELYGGVGDDTLLGGEGNDYFALSEGDDRHVGGAGDDRFEDHRGNDTFFGGAGADHFTVLGSGGAVRASGGDGQDTYQVHGRTFSSGSYLITDFAVAEQRDLLDVDFLLNSSALDGDYEGGNPFAQGILRLQKSGENTLLQWDVDGSGIEYGWITQLTLRRVMPSQVTSGNFLGGIRPDGLPVPGELFEGTPETDEHDGTFFNDTLLGGGSRDVLDGNPGADHIDGGEGDDELYGGVGDDTLLGGEGNDYFGLSEGNDWYAGGSGNDRFEDHRGSDTFLGGAGADHFTVLGTGGTVRANGGDGQDTYQVHGKTFASGSYSITDFAVGEQRDLLDVDFLLNFSALDGGYEGGNPFAQGILRLQSSNGNSVLQWDVDGSGTEYGWITQLTLRGVLPSEITSDNFVGGIHPDGSPVPGELFEGTAETDEHDGTFFNDTLLGAGSRDVLDGNPGADHIDGGEGDDELHGGVGNDTLLGGEGNDYFGLSEGHDWYAGGSGNDRFEDHRGNDTFFGGGGADHFTVLGSGGAVRTSGGDGQDTYQVHGKTFASGSYLITDFAVGEQRDLLDVDFLLNSSALDGDYEGGDPFAQGFLRLVKSGDKTLLQWDVDGRAAEYGWITQLALRGVLPSEITSDNFVGLEIVGTEGNDDLAGGLGNDTVRGLGGDDSLDGSLGRDVLEGGDGNDTYFVDSAEDNVVELEDMPVALVLPGGDGWTRAGVSGDRIIAAIDYVLGQYVEHLRLQGAAASGTGNALANEIIGNQGGDRLFGGAGNDTLDGGAGNDTLNGDAGNDFLVWGTGDVLNGGSETDTLVLGRGNLDLRGIDQSALSSLERVDLRRDGQNTLTLTRRDVLDMSATNTLTVLGDTGDRVVAAGFTSVESPDGVYQRFLNGTAVLLVESDVLVTV